MFVVWAVAIYAMLGAAVALAFVTVGLRQVQPAPYTLGARVLIFPGAAALWPYVLRWIGRRR
jgi:hypothetical protein